MLKYVIDVFSHNCVTFDILFIELHYRASVELRLMPGIDDGSERIFLGNKSLSSHRMPGDMRRKA